VPLAVHRTGCAVEKIASPDPAEGRHTTAMSDRLAVNDKAPMFTLKDQSGQDVKLSGFKGRKVLVYFYPKADTPGCTTQACGLRDILGEIGDTAVLGISPDAPAKQAKFDQKYGLGFPLLADEDHAVAEAFGVWTEKSMYGRKYMGIERSAFLIDEKGGLERVWYKVSAKDTPKLLLESLKAA
jgi:peroxiredoxin Q/BCP